MADVIESNMAELETRRLILRKLRTSDVGLISLYSSDWRVASMTTSIPYPNPPGAVQVFVERATRADAAEMSWAIDATKAFGTEIIGVITLRPDGELGYWIAPFFWGMGLATEAAQAVVDFAISTGHDRVHACHFADNPGSARVLQKVGMQPVGGACESFSVSRGEKVQNYRYELRHGTP